jgi:hypothetical protein
VVVAGDVDARDAGDVRDAKGHAGDVILQIALADAALPAGIRGAGAAATGAVAPTALDQCAGYGPFIAVVDGVGKL